MIQFILHPIIKASLLLVCLCVACTSAQKSDIKSETQSVAKSSTYKLPKSYNSFFNKFDFNDTGLPNNESFKLNLTQYFDKEIRPVNSNILSSMDMLMKSAGNNSSLKKFLFNYFHEKYRIPKFVTDDDILIHLSDNYGTADIIPWFGQGAYDAMKKHVKKLKPVSIGKIAPKFEADIITGGRISSNNLGANYTVLFFWSPSCDECTKEIPALQEFAQTHKDQNINILTICNSVGEFAHECETGVQEKGLNGFTNLCDKDGEHTIIDAFYATSTPFLYVLDQNNKILIKRIGTNALPKVFSDLKNGTLNFN